MNASELRAAIARNGMTIPGLAVKIGISKKALYQKIASESQFTQREMVAIAEALGLSRDGILDIFFADEVS